MIKEAYDSGVEAAEAELEKLGGPSQNSPWIHTQTSDGTRIGTMKLKNTNLKNALKTHGKDSRVKRIKHNGPNEATVYLR